MNTKKLIALFVALLLVLAPAGELPLTGFGTIAAEAADVVALNKTALTLVTKKTYQLTLSTDKSVKWSSADKSIATVSASGLVTAIKAGKTTITAKSNGKTYTCAVTVGNSTVKAFKLGYTITEKDTTIENDRFVVEIPAGVYVPKTLEKDINTVMDAIEDITGLSYYPDYLETSMDGFAEKRVVITVEKSAKGQEYDSAYAIGGTGILVSPGDLLFGSGEALGLTHELLHVINARNGSLLSQGLFEGFTTYFVQRIIEGDYYPIIFNSYFNYSGFDNITSKNAEKLFGELDSDGWNAYLYGFRLMPYIMETYGMEDYIKLCRDLDSDNDIHTNTELIAPLKKHYGNDFFKKFGSWFEKNKKRFAGDSLTYDFSDFSRINVYPYYSFWSFYEAYSFTYSDYLVADFSSGFEYAEKYRGDKPVGSITATMSAEGKTTAKFYSAAGKLLKTVKLTDEQQTVTVKNAATVKFIGDGKLVCFEPSFDDMIK